ncbi:MAG: MBL fold metallo-hydrolase [Candidatus Hodarchaeales archaeon]
MLEIQFFGAAKSVGKSCVMISDKDRRVILDAGIQLHPRRTGLLSDAPKEVLDYADEINAVILSHAHVDHSAYTPALYKAGYNGSTHMTYPTKEIVKILWKDHLKIEGPNHFNSFHLKKAINNIHTHYYKKRFKIDNGITCEFLDASHILGSASILLDWEGTRILYTGDFNDAKTPFHDSITYPDPDKPIDILLIETTNAKRKINSRKETTSDLTKSLLKCYGRGGKAIIPSFALGRSQEIQAYLTNDFDSFLHKYPLYIDGMILEINKVYNHFMNEKWVSPRILLNLKERGLYSPFDHEGIHKIDEIPLVGNRARKREVLATQRKQSIILTTSGMLEGGPVYDYLRYTGGDNRNGLFIVGYQVPGTVGADIVSGKTRVKLDDGFGQEFDVDLLMEIKHFEFSGHSTLDGLIQMVRYSSPRKIYAMHGEPESQKQFYTTLKDYGSEATILSTHQILPEYP